MSKNKKRVLFFLTFFISVSVAAAVLIRFAQGYRPDLTSLKFKPNGLLVATSTPDGAQVYIDGKLYSATNTTLNLTPGKYEVEIKKDGFTSWKKTLTVKKELVTKTDAYLFPAFPDLRSLTFTGAANPLISPDGQKIVYTVAGFSAEKNGLWVLDLADLPLGFSREPKQIAVSDKPGHDFADSSYCWSPDSKQILATIKKAGADKTVPAGESNYLLDINELNPGTLLIDTTPRLNEIYKRWQVEKDLREKALLAKLPEKLALEIDGKTKDLVFSPDDTKILYTATASGRLSDKIIPPLPAASTQPEARQLEPGKVYVYDLKEDRNFYIMDTVSPAASPTPTPITAKKTLPTATPAISSQNFLTFSTSRILNLTWFPTSKHLFYVQPNKITILEYDNTNRNEVYTGRFENSFAFPFPAGNRILVLTALESEKPANLYAISLR